MLGTSRPSGVSGNAGFLTARMPAGNRNSGLRGGSRQCARRSNVSLVDSATDWGMIAKRPRRSGKVAVTRSAMDAWNRSEEHTSELQSPCNLVCRLLLEKKKKLENLIRIL